MNISPKPTPYIEYHVKSSVTLQSGGFLSYKPYDYDYAENKTKLWPLVIFLPGITETSDGSTQAQLDATRNNGPMYLVDHTSASFPAVILTPPGYAPPNGDWTNSTRVCDFVDYATQQYRIDKSRVYITGLSLGGYGVGRSTFKCPDKFAAQIPIESNIDAPWPFSWPDHPELKAPYASMAYWGFSNAGDHGPGCIDCATNWANQTPKLTYPSSTITLPSDAMSKSYQADFDPTTQKFVWTARGSEIDIQYPTPGTNGVEAHFATAPRSDHNGWTRAYNSCVVWTWLFDQKKK